MDPSRGDSRYNLNYSMGGIGLGLADPADLYGSPGLSTVTGRPPSGGLIQSMGRSQPGLMGTAGQGPGQCQTLGGNGSQQQQSRGVKRTSSDCYEDHHRGTSGGGGGGGMQSQQSLQGMESCAGGVGQPGPGGGNVQDGVDDGYNTTLPNKKSPPANGKKTKGRVKIKMEYIDNKLRRYTTFSKRKTGIMKKAYELSTLTGTQVMLLVASETGHVYTFATRKLQPMITSEAGKQLIQTCLNSPDPPSDQRGGDQRMSATGFEETELSYNIADEDSKDGRSPMSSGDSDDSSDIDEPGPANLSKNHGSNSEGQSPSKHSRNANASYSASAIPQISQEFLLNLVQSGHLQLHADEDGRQIATMQMVPAGNSSNSGMSVGNSTASSSSGGGGGGSGGGGNTSQGRSVTSRNNRSSRAKDLSTKGINSSRSSAANGRESPSSLTDHIVIKEETFDDF